MFLFVDSAGIETASLRVLASEAARLLLGDPATVSSGRLGNSVFSARSFSSIFFLCFFWPRCLLLGAGCGSLCPWRSESADLRGSIRGISSLDILSDVPFRFLISCASLAIPSTAQRVSVVLHSVASKLFCEMTMWSRRRSRWDSGADFLTSNLFLDKIVPMRRLNISQISTRGINLVS